MDAATSVGAQFLASLSPEQRALFHEYQRLQDEGRDLWQTTFEREITRHLVQPRCLLALLFTHLRGQFLGDIGRCCWSSDRPEGHS